MSRLRSGRGASPAAAAKPARSAGRGASAGGRPGVYVQSPKSDIFVALLGVALGAMFLGCLLLLLILNRYEFKTKVSALPAAAYASRLA